MASWQFTAGPDTKANINTALGALTVAKLTCFDPVSLSSATRPSRRTLQPPSRPPRAHSRLWWVRQVKRRSRFKVIETPWLRRRRAWSPARSRSPLSKFGDGDGMRLVAKGQPHVGLTARISK